MPDASRSGEELILVHSSDLHVDDDRIATLHGGDGTAGLHAVLIRTRSDEPNSGLHQEAREWQGVTIASLPEVLQLVKREGLD